MNNDEKLDLVIEMVLSLHSPSMQWAYRQKLAGNIIASATICEHKWSMPNTVNMPAVCTRCGLADE